MLTIEFLVMCVEKCVFGGCMLLGWQARHTLQAVRAVSKGAAQYAIESFVELSRPDPIPRTLTTGFV